MNVKNNGFTLVELAIVMVIVGLLIGGILKGQAMIQAARISATISQIKGYQAAANLFSDRYNALPGDMLNARTRIPSCTAANFCLNGNGDTRIGSSTTNYSRNNENGATNLPSVETSMFWKHLALSDLITGIDTNANPATPAWGSTHPTSKANGGIVIMHINETSATEPAVGHFFMFRKPPTGDPHVAAVGQGALSPDWAKEIDTKIDDGNCQTGTIRADEATSCARAGRYLTPNSTPNCVVIFKM